MEDETVVELGSAILPHGGEAWRIDHGARTAVVTDVYGRRGTADRDACCTVLTVSGPREATKVRLVVVSSLTEIFASLGGPRVHRIPA